MLDSVATDFTGTDLWASLLWITDALPLEAFARFVLVEVVRVDLDKLLKTVSTFDLFHIWTLVALASSMPATLTVFISGRNMLTSWAGSKIALLFDAWSWEGWGVSDPGWDTKLEDTDVWLALPDIIGFVSEVGTVDTWTDWYKFVVPLTLVNGADAVKENITTVVLVSSEDWFVVFWTSLDSWAFSFWDTDALLHVAWAVDVSSLVTEAVAVVLKSNLLSTTAGSWEGLWTLAVATVGASLVDAAASIDGRVLGAESLLFTWNWVVAWLSGAVHSWYVVLKLALAELALGTWIRMPFVSNSVLDVVIDTESVGGWTDTCGVRVAVGGDVVNADLVVAAFVTSWWRKAKSVTAFLFAWVSKGELSTAAAGSSTALVEHLVTTGENKLAVVVTVLGNVGVWILVGSAIVDAWLVRLAWAVGTAAWAVWMLEDIVRLAGLAHWWLFQAELWSADTLLLLAIEVTGGIKSINVVGVGGLEAWGEARVSAHWSVAGNWHLWHWSWVSVDAHWWSLWALPSIAASAFTVVVLTVGLGDKDWITVLADWSGIADISDVGADNGTVVTAATGLAAVSDNWVGRDDLLPDLVGLVGDAFVFALEATVTCVREAAALVGAGVELATLADARWWSHVWAWSWGWALISLATSDFGSVLEDFGVDEFTSGFGSWAASAGWVKSNSLLGSDGLASLLLWTLLWDAFVPVTATEWVLEAENLLESGSADEVVGASEVFTGLLGDAVSDLALAWLAHVVVLLPGLSVFVDDAVVLADWGTAALAVGLALALIEVVGSGADMSGSVTGGVAVLTWFLALLWWALALLGWATTGWLVVAINNLAVVSALDSWSWASLADASVAHATVFRTGNVSTGIVFLVFATAWVWVEFWELDGALSLGSHTDALWWIDWKTFGLLAALGNGESVNSLVFGTDWVGVTSIS